ncbi:MAG: ATP-dependent Clp protease ATP-binding subunit [Candidatus Saccharibacteria bacterium]|nr:ATP-dependent Clp protease ATP-binding subunit [Candidatus Saccharibacteria bacterium]
MGTAMDDLKFNYSSVRSGKARISIIFNKNWIMILSISVILLSWLGIMMLALKSPLGWAFIGLASVPAMIVQWYNGELKHIPIASSSKTIDDVLSGEVLGRLSKKPSPQEVATIISKLPGGYFFSVRFGIGSKFLQELASADSNDMQKVWGLAWDLQKQTGSKNISAAILIVAILRSTPNYQTLISHLQLDDSDLLRGIEWYNHLREIIEKHRQPKRTGGVARDWSFGWTPMLNRFGLQMGGDSVFQLVAHEESLEQLMGIFSKRGRQNVVLVGQSGSGKTEIVEAFASRLLDARAKVPKNLRFRQVYNLDAASLIAAAPDRGGLEQLIPRVLGEAYSSKNIIICLDNAQLFFEDGIGSVDITNVLLPILKAGNLRMILTVDEQRFLQIGKRNPELVNALNRIVVPPANRDESIKIMQDQTIMVEFQNDVTFMYQALVEAYRLGDRYVHDQAMPGKAIKIMESAANYGDRGLVSAESVRQAIEKTMDIKVSVATDTNEREKLLNLEELIHGRMINQVRAVNVVSDALRRARAGVRNLNRPIGTFLFLGPTGVGKTELAKSLAEIYFKGEDHIIRVDMNEYVGADDVNRLIADGADNANSLTARVMKQPFSVVLLDEIEKAHTNVMSTLLQMLDEGILRDIKNREVSFRDAIIVATSNAGADRIREYIDRGYDIQQFEDKFVDELISSNQFRPEFLNRFDEIVMFRPLNKSELLKVVDLMINSVNKTLALQKVSVKVADDAKEYLVEAGYDPRLGARPMRRVVQRAVENTVAKQMLSGTVEPGSVIEISLDQVKQIIDSKVAADKIVEEEKVS